MSTRYDILAEFTPNGLLQYPDETLMADEIVRLRDRVDAVESDWQRTYDHDCKKLIQRAEMLMRQRDMAEEERDSWKVRAMQAEQDRQIIRKNMDDLIVNVNVAMAERERALRAERDALRNYVEEKLNITKLTRLHGEELDRYILALVNAEANCEALLVVNGDLARDNETLEAECEALLSVIERVRPSIHLDAALAVQPATGGADE